jgi:hypothetical protein
MIERRALPREPVLAPGEIVLHGSEPLPCFVRNVTPTGARLRLGTAVPLPTRFPLRISGRTELAELIWQNGTSVGVRFS